MLRLQASQPPFAHISPQIRPSVSHICASHLTPQWHRSQNQHLVSITQMSHLIPLPPLRFLGYPSRGLCCCLSINFRAGIGWNRGNCASVCVFTQPITRKHSPVASCRPLSPLLCTFWCEIAFSSAPNCSSILIGEEAQSILPVKWQRGWQPLKWKQSSGLISIAVGSPQLDATMRQKTTRDEIRGNTADERGDRNCRGVADNV